MRHYFFVSTLFFLMNAPSLFAQSTPPPASPDVAYPALQIPEVLAEKLFYNAEKKLLNCPLLFEGSWSYPDGYVASICNDAQLACLRYGLLVQKIKKTSNGRLLQELQKTLALEKQEVGMRLRACQIILEATLIEGKTLQESTGYVMGDPSSAYSSQPQ